MRKLPIAVSCELTLEQQASSLKQTTMSVSTLGELARCDARAQQAMTTGKQAFSRLLKRVEHSDSGQTRRVAAFIAATFNGRTFPLEVFELRAVDVTISDDMLRCLDALRCGRTDLYTLIPDGEARVRSVTRTIRQRDGA